ncbi:MAG: hypothetical protein ACRD2U_06835 [Terriglobales bacterium]
MKSKSEKDFESGPVSFVLAALSGWALWGWAVWLVLRSKTALVLPEERFVSPDAEPSDFVISAADIHQPASNEWKPPKQQPQRLESLSQKTPGDAPLDRLARAASNGEHGRATSFRGEQTILSGEEVLKTQALESARLPGWNLPRPANLPVPTFAPAIMAMGIVVFAMGLVTTWYVCAAGAMIFAVATWRWVGELQEG